MGHLGEPVFRSRCCILRGEALQCRGRRKGSACVDGVQGRVSMAELRIKGLLRETYTARLREERGKERLGNELDPLNVF